MNSDQTSARNILDEIVAHKRSEIVESKKRAQRESWRARAESLGAPPDFLAALRRPGRIRAIAEIKKASPSAGLLRTEFDPGKLAHAYRAGGADCLSVLTDTRYFQGSIEDLAAVHRTVDLPLLRKDFILCPEQIYEAKLAGASAILLIAECLEPTQMRDLVALAGSLGLAALVELHERKNLAAVLDSGARLIGINNRDLRSFTTSLEHTLSLVPEIPADRTIVSESGIRAPEEVRRLADAGVAAILVGESLLRAPDPGEKLAALLGF